jgi:hypothetical protein
MMDRESKGISFHYNTGRGTYHVGRSWASIHILMMKLNNCQKYSTSDRSLSVWLLDQELFLRFRAQELEEEVKFSPAETGRIIDYLGRAPNFN